MKLRVSKLKEHDLIDYIKKHYNTLYPIVRHITAKEYIYLFIKYNPGCTLQQLKKYSLFNTLTLQKLLFLYIRDGKVLMIHDGKRKTYYIS